VESQFIFRLIFVALTGFFGISDLFDIDNSADQCFRYCSYNAHVGNDQGRVDDMWGILVIFQIWKIRLELETCFFSTALLSSEGSCLGLVLSQTTVKSIRRMLIVKMKNYS
jgi:hypothetical protein